MKYFGGCDVGSTYTKAVILDENGNHVKKGECGEIVVTGFTNVGLPFVRYKTGDLAIYGGTQRNGTVVISNLLGRSKDFVYDKQGEKVYLVGFIFGGHIKAFNDIREWQIHQKEKGKLVITIVKGVSFCQKTEDELLYDKTQKVIDLFKSIKNQVENEFPDANIKILVDAFSYRLNDKLICKFIFLKNYLNLYFYTDEIEDIEGKLEDISGKNLEGNTYYRFKLTSEEDIDYFIELFRQIYR